MKCKYCGHEQPENFVYCPNCGAKNEENIFENNFEQPDIFDAEPPKSPILKLIQDKLFLAVCVLMAASCIFNIASGGLPILSILLTVFLWLVYVKGRNNVADYEQLKNVSGTVYASYIINYIGAGAIALLGICFTALFSMVGNDPEFIEEVIEETQELSGLSYEILSQFMSILMPVIGIIFVVIGIIVAVINFFARGSIHKFLKTSYMSVSDPTVQPVKVKTASVWLIVLGVMNTVSGITSMFIGTIAGGVAYILAGMLIQKYFENK